MLYIPKIDDYLENLADEEVNNFVSINFSEYQIYKNMYSKPNEEQILRKGAYSPYIFLTTADEVEKYLDIMQSNSSDMCVNRYGIKILNLFDPELQLYH